MTQNYSKKVLWVFIPVTAAVSIAMGSVLSFLVKIRESAGTGYSADISAGTAVVLMSGVIIYAMLLLIQLTYFHRTSQKNIAQNTVIKNKSMAQKSDAMEAIGRLQQEYIDAEKSHKAGRRFMTRMSHDLRTPMNAILGYSMLIERFSDDRDRVNQYAERIYVSGQMLLELINDALDMSCIENGNVKLIESEFSLLSALEEIKTAIKPLTEAKDQTFRFYITNSAGIDKITGDKQRLCQVLRNILSNASKYTPENGCIDMMVTIIENGRGNGQLLCQIKDTGYGMSREFLKVLFEPFEREDTELNTSVPGTGLGLCIARSFTELMGGEITVESEPGAGTLVTVQVPIKVEDENNGGITGGFHESDVLKGLRFLAAEDNESNAEILSEVLKMMGAECTLIQHGQAAVEAFENSEPGQYDVILLDIQMPVMNGYQAAAAVRRSRHPDAKDIKIIAMTADAFEEDVQRAFISGMDAHVAKPLDLEAFANTVASFGLKDKKITGVS